MEVFILAIGKNFNREVECNTCTDSCICKLQMVVVMQDARIEQVFAAGDHNSVARNAKETINKGLNLITFKKNNLVLLLIIPNGNNLFGINVAGKMKNKHFSYRIGVRVGCNPLGFA